jgi:hypothetical protein
VILPVPESVCLLLELVGDKRACKAITVWDSRPAGEDYGASGVVHKFC